MGIFRSAHTRIPATDALVPSPLLKNGTLLNYVGIQWSDGDLLTFTITDIVISTANVMQWMK